MKYTKLGEKQFLKSVDGFLIHKLTTMGNGAEYDSAC